MSDMLVRAYLDWLTTAPPEGRAEAVAVMAETVLSGCLVGEDKVEAESALMLTLDDDALIVRRALAQALAPSDKAPRAVILALAHDLSPVSSHVLLASPLLTDADLVDTLDTADRFAQTAIALRPGLRLPVTRAIAEKAVVEAVVAMMASETAEIAPAAFARAAERFSDHAELRGVMLEREDLPVAVRQRLVFAVSGALQSFLSQTQWLSDARAERCVSEAERRATIAIATDCDRQETDELIVALRTAKRLTPNLLLRAVLSGETGLLEASLAQLSGMQRHRVAAMLNDPGGSALSAVYDRAGLPASLKIALLNAVRGNLATRQRSAPLGELEIATIRSTLIACEARRDDSLAPAIALLRRYEAEALRELARAVASDLRATPAPIAIDAVADVVAMAVDQPETDLAAILPDAEPPAPIEPAAPANDADASEEVKIIRLGENDRFAPARLAA
jgi:uncharacterized protein (DUF2336 family)